MQPDLLFPQLNFSIFTTDKAQFVFPSRLKLPPKLLIILELFKYSDEDFNKNRYLCALFSSIKIFKKFIWFLTPKATKIVPLLEEQFESLKFLMEINIFPIRNRKADLDFELEFLISTEFKESTPWSLKKIRQNLKHNY